MTHDEIVALLDGRGQGFADGDPDVIAAPYARNAVMESPLSGISVGKDAIRQAYAQLISALGSDGFTTSPGSFVRLGVLKERSAS